MEKIKGIFLIVMGAMLWGATGPLMEFILENTGMTVSFMLTIRLLVAGLAILLFLVATKKSIFPIWRSAHWRRQLIIFSVLGMLGLQFSFVTAINVSNAVFATLLQFLGPIFIVIFLSIKLRTWPPKYQLLGIMGTFFGLFLLLTNFSLDSLLVSTEAIIWGVMLGVTFAIYTLHPVALMNEWGVLVVVGWGMLVGGAILGITTFVWNSEEWVLLLNINTSLWMVVLIFFGTIAFILFLSSMKYISPVLTSILSSIEPLTAMVISIIVFHTTLGLWQALGVFIMLGCVTWLSIVGEKAESYNNE
ncbi:DMT family transporter [Lysinibacillus sp. BW-2-10]|uniref:DMT family transporter n=1 Tax=Lysinibacillus sp. BW-2-10 TaxID=2590030 RepID=UPI0011812D8B|nr:DMT family transporter [Lysinibacillus sp. BW-2-10]TSI05984.1 EamA family transporter [Lysinibacillus sp. BW-2-10]